MSKERQSDWEPSRCQNLIRYRPSGTYFARFKAGGKIVRKSLKTSVFSVAKLRLPDTIKAHRSVYQSRRRFGAGKMTFGGAVQTYRDKLEANSDLKPRSKYYYRLILQFIEKSWPGILAKDIRDISESDCKCWHDQFRQRYAASVTNNAVSVLRAIFGEAVATGARFSNPTTALKRARVRPKKLQLPSREEFLRFVQVIKAGASRDSKNASDLVRFLAYSGLRIGEAANVTWSDVDWQRNRLQVRGDPETGTKNGEIRFVPMIPALAEMLRGLQQARRDEPVDTTIMKVRECQKSMNRAAQFIGIERITHHDLRHLFATIAIESGVDIPTISRWLGHKDGGALCMKTYGHLRDEHSSAQAQRVHFS